MSKVNLHCDDDTPDQLHDWTTAISERIRELNWSEVCSLTLFPGLPTIQLLINYCSMQKLEGEGLGMRLVCTLTAV